ncbi:hypothetical protein [Endozoicomonas sp. ALC066]|uniref:hypothetical protein n=2 Tax=unclassified Endozoicomonas TaxID=2644528 RepID=UPI003BB73DA6
MRKLPMQSSNFNHENVAKFIAKWAALFSHGGIVILLKTLSESLVITLGDKSLSVLMVVSCSWLLSPVGLKPGLQAAVGKAAMILSVLRLSAGRRVLDHTLPLIPNRRDIHSSHSCQSAST